MNQTGALALFAKEMGPERAWLSSSPFSAIWYSGLLTDQKGPMTDQNLTHILAILDRSGSMQSIKADTEGGFNSYIEEQKKVEGETYVSLVQFDTEYEVVYTTKPLNEVPKLNLVPRGGTALHDAIGKAVTAKGEELAALPEDKRPGSVVVLVLTDGWENSSKEWTGDAVKKLVKQQQDDYEWNFIFMGSNQDAVLVGATLGFLPTNSLTYTGANTQSAFASAAASTATYRSARAAGQTYDVALASAAFTDEDREAATK